MLGDTDLTNPIQIEQIRRSVAMLTHGEPALDREDSLRVLAALKAQVEANRP